MATKLYKIQTWDKAGALTNSYEAEIDTPAHYRELLKFLQAKWAHVVIVPTKRAHAEPAPKRAHPEPVKSPPKRAT